MNEDLQYALSQILEGLSVPEKQLSINQLKNWFWEEVAADLEFLGLKEWEVKRLVEQYGNVTIPTFLYGPVMDKLMEKGKR